MLKLLRLKTPGGMQRDDDEYDGRRGRGQYRPDDDRYDSDVTDDYRSEESGGEWSNSYGSMNIAVISEVVMIDT